MAETECEWIKDVTDETFEVDVFEASKSQPVVVDFWAEWCQPCLMLKPILEKLAKARDGAFVLAKCNTNETPKVAQEFGVQGIPAVYAVVDGEVVDFFTGVQPEDMLNRWLDGLGSFQVMKNAEALEQSDPNAAEEIYLKLLDEREDNAPARIGLARALLAMNELEACRDEISKLERRGFLEPEAEKVLAALHLRQNADCDLGAAQQAAESNPDDLDAQIALADAQSGQGQHQAALDTLLSVIEKQKDGPGNTARERMLELFKVLGDDSELTRDYRRRLSALLF